MTGAAIAGRTAKPAAAIQTGTTHRFNVVTMAFPALWTSRATKRYQTGSQNLTVPIVAKKLKTSFSLGNWDLEILSSFVFRH
jgi:hypothetical protein